MGEGGTVCKKMGHLLFSAISGNSDVEPELMGFRLLPGWDFFFLFSNLSLRTPSRNSLDKLNPFNLLNTELRMKPMQTHIYIYIHVCECVPIYIHFLKN